MARRLRLESLPQDQQNKLRDISTQYFPRSLQQEFLDSIEQAGAISPELFRQGNFSQADADQVSSLVSQVTQGLPSAQDAYNRFLKGQGTDPSALTDQELQDRINAFKGLGRIPQDATAGVERLKKEILSVFNSDQTLPISADPNRDSIARQLADSVYAGENIGSALLRITGGSPNRYKTTILQLENKIPPVLTDVKKPTTDYSSDIKTIQDLISNRERTAKSQAEIDAFNASLPGELSAHIQDFLKSQYASAGQKYKTEIAPEIIQTMAVRGLLTSGDLASELASGAATSIANVEQIAADLLSQDTAFWEQAGYNDSLRKAVSAGQDVAGQISADRTAADLAQEQRFKGSETALNRQHQLDLFTRQQQRALESQTARLQRERDIRSRSRTAGLASSAGTAASTAGSAFTLAGHPEVGLPLIAVGGVAGLFD